MREVVEPTVNERGYETHPAWGMISVHRSQIGPTGAVLFDSDVRHNNVVKVRLHEAERKRDLGSDHKHAGKVISEVTFSEAQWAAFIASTNLGSGMPCTINFREAKGGPQPEMPFKARLQESLAEVRGAAEHSIEMIRAAFEKVKAKPNKGNIHHLECMIDNAPSNMEFAAKQLDKHAEKVVTNVKSDIEAMALNTAKQLGIEPGDIGYGAPQLTEGDVSEPIDEERP